MHISSLVLIASFISISSAHPMPITSAFVSTTVIQDGLAKELISKRNFGPTDLTISSDNINSVSGSIESVSTSGNTAITEQSTLLDPSSSPLDSSTSLSDESSQNGQKTSFLIDESSAVPTTESSSNEKTPSFLTDDSSATLQSESSFNDSFMSASLTSDSGCLTCPYTPTQCSLECATGFTCKVTAESCNQCAEEQCVKESNPAAISSTTIIIIIATVIGVILIVTAVVIYRKKKNAPVNPFKVKKGQKKRSKSQDVAQPQPAYPEDNYEYSVSNHPPEYNVQQRQNEYDDQYYDDQGASNQYYGDESGNNNYYDNQQNVGGNNQNDKQSSKTGNQDDSYYGYFKKAVYG